MISIRSFVLETSFASKVTPDAIRPESISVNIADVTVNFFIALCGYGLYIDNLDIDRKGFPK